MRALLLRSRRYQSWHADPRIALRTHFFAAAAVVTRVLAGQLLLSRFLRELSGTLEVENALRARRIRAGTLYAAGPVDGNTLDFVCHEQAIVQAHLDRLRRCAPRRYSREISAANRALSLARSRTFQAVADRCFAGAAYEAARRLGGALDFADRHCREVLGTQIARWAVPRSQASG